MIVIVYYFICGTVVSFILFVEADNNKCNGSMAQNGIQMADLMGMDGLERKGSQKLIVLGFKVDVASFVYAVIISFFTTPEWSVILCTFLGVVLLGASLIAINVFISVLTESMIIAAVFGMAVGLLISMMSYFASMISLSWISNALKAISFMEYYQNFTYGILSIVDVVFFLSVTALFLFFTVRALEKRRWS